MKFPSLSVFFPAYNDAPSLPGLLQKTFATLESHVADYEMIVVNDGSQDQTAEVLKDLGRKYAASLRVVTHPENRGYGGALRSGFPAARKDFVFYTDGDSQYDVTELPCCWTGWGRRQAWSMDTNWNGATRRTASG